MNIRYYLSIFPIEALIASQLDPEAFGVYMATGSHRGSAEGHAFIEVGDLDQSFDFAYAEKKCAASGAERKKNSVYLSVYRTLEKIALSSMGTLYLVTRDGRSLPLEPTMLEGPSQSTRKYYLYQEMSPLRPVVVTRLAPSQFCRYMTQEETKIHVPRIAFADLRVIDLDNLDDAGNIGNLYHENITHLRDCIQSVTTKTDKIAKTLDRARVESFSYNLVDTGVYIGDPHGVLHYPMKSLQQLQMHHFPWAKSAMIV